MHTSPTNKDIYVDNESEIYSIDDLCKLNPFDVISPSKDKDEEDNVDDDDNIITNSPNQTNNNNNITNFNSMLYTNYQPYNTYPLYPLPNIYTQSPYLSHIPHHHQSPYKKDFKNLNDLLSSLKNNKQLSSFIKSRKNTETMCSLLKKLTQSELNELISLISSNMKDIMIINNKFCQKLFEQCTPQQRLLILKQLQPYFISIAMDKWGSYSLQALIKIISLPEEQEIIKTCIEGKVEVLAMDKQANFVLQKLILLFNEKGISSITEEIFKIFHQLILHPNGVCLLKNLIMTHKSSEIRKQFVSKVKDNLINIINDQHSHTLILQMMEKWDFETCKGVIYEVFRGFHKYILLQYSPFVLLRCVQVSEDRFIKHLAQIYIKTERFNELFQIGIAVQIIASIYSKLSKDKQIEWHNELEKYFTKEQMNALFN